MQKRLGGERGGEGKGRGGEGRRAGRGEQGEGGRGGREGTGGKGREGGSHFARKRVLTYYSATVHLLSRKSFVSNKLVRESTKQHSAQSETACY